jgi:hypothetical protein
MGEAMSLDAEAQAELDAVNALRAKRGDSPLTAGELWPGRNAAMDADLPETRVAGPVEPEAVNAAPVLEAIRAVGQPRLERVVRAAVAAWCTREGRNPQEGVAYAVGQARKFLRDGELMRHGWTWKRFFGDGYWASESLWPYDQVTLARLRQGVAGRIGARHEGRRDHRR